MTSIFDLKTNVSELSSANEGTSKMEYEQHPPTRDVVNNSFPNGAIHFRFQTSGQKWWIPSKSYLRMRLQLTKGDGTPVDVAFGAAPNMGLMSNLFQSGEFRINDKVISRVADFMPQVDALETRLTKSKSWLDSVGESTNWWAESQSLRLAEVANDGTIVKDTVAIVPPETTAIDTNIGYAANNSVAYVAQTGVITFAAGAGPAVPNTDVNWQVGDYIVLTTLPNNEDGVLNVKAEVLVVNANATMTVRADWPVDVAADNGIRFSRVRPNPIDAPPSRRIGEFETFYQPPLSLFKIGHALPSGRYELVLNPQTSSSYMKRAIESVLGQASKDPQPVNAIGNPALVKVNVVDFYLYCATVDGPRADDMTYLLDLEQTRCQAEKIDTTNFQQKNFDVSPSTFALTAAYQDLRVGENTALSSSKFKSYDAAAIPANSEELKLNRFFINYAGQNLPAPDADPNFQAGIDYTTQRYGETQIYSGAYFDTGGAETIEEWHDRGAYYYFSWPRDGTDRSTRVNVHQQFNAADVVNMRLLLFDHSKQVGRVRIMDGRIVDVQLEHA
jgi:hypothetical protein